MSDKQPIDPDIISKLVARKLKRRKPSLLPTIVVGIILFNVLASVLGSEQFAKLLPFAAFALLWIGVIVVPRVLKRMRAFSETVKETTATTAPKRKHCKSCDIKHSPDTRYCRRCGAPLLR